MSDFNPLIPLEDIPFCRGFLFGRDDTPDVPERFVAASLPGGYWFHADPTLAFHVVAAEAESGVWVLIAGSAIHIGTGATDLAALGQTLAGTLTESDASFFDAVDLLSGRFLIVAARKSDVRILHDATGMRAVFHTTGRQPVVASHAGLLAPLTAARPSAPELERRKNPALSFGYGYPGRATPYADVYVLMPNTLLNAETGAIVRYFPRKERAETEDVDRVVDMLLVRMQVQATALLQGSERVLVSLTAGVDSRTTLAALRPHVDKLHFFTYTQVGHESLQRDEHVARWLVAEGTLDHEVLVLPQSEDHPLFEHFDNQMDRNTYRRHNRPLAFQYWRRFGGVPTMHVRSNVTGIGKTVYNRRRIRPPLRDARRMTHTFSRDLEGNRAIQAAFEDFSQATGFYEVRGYDPYDMFYWEHRLGTWHAHLLIESDPAFDTHVLYNNRPIIEALLSLPFEARNRDEAFHRLIARSWPELGAVPTNPVDWRSIIVPQ